MADELEYVDLPEEEDCAECGGEGFRTTIRGTGMHAVEFDLTCGRCGGTGLQEAS